MGKQGRKNPRMARANVGPANVVGSPSAQSKIQNRKSKIPTMTYPPRTTTQEIEHGATFQPKFGADGLIPCITQDIATGQILMFAFMNAESLGHTLATKKATYWSRSRNKLWVKGEESGNVQWVRELHTDCDQDVLLIKVEQAGPANAACHNGYKSCFYRKLASLDAAATGDFKLTTTATPLFDPATVYKKKT
jgi:phosphoribosyl-AMP cyclohydrolase